MAESDITASQPLWQHRKLPSRESHWCHSSPAKFVESGVADAEVMGNLMDNGDSDLMDDLLAAVADCNDGFTEDGDSVGQGAGFPPGITLGQGRSLIEAEQDGVGVLLCAGRVFIGCEDGHIVHLGADVCGDVGRAASTAVSKSSSLMSKGAKEGIEDNGFSCMHPA